MFHSGMSRFRRPKDGEKKRASKKVSGARRRLCDHTRQELVEILDTEFSFNVRAGAVIGGGGFARCITCGKPGGMADMDCGHYVTRAIHRTRWLRINTGPQCPKCNRFLNGMAHAFRAYLVETYGVAEVDRLEELAKDTGWRDSAEGLIAKIEELRRENRELRKELRCFTP
jgi:hypothetical protein